MSHVATGWPFDHGPTNVGAMVKRGEKTLAQIGRGHSEAKQVVITSQKIDTIAQAISFETIWMGE